MKPTLTPAGSSSSRNYPAYAPARRRANHCAPAGPRKVADSRGDDRALVARLVAGDERALEALFDLHAGAVRYRMTRLLGSEAQAEEVVQETFLQAWQQANRYRPSRASVRGWLMVVARSRALDRLRSRQARKRREERHSSSAGDRVSTPPSVLRDLQAAELRRGLAQALGFLPPEQRQCIELAYFQGLSQRQIAERLSAPLGTVKSRVLLGVKKLRQTLQAA